MRRPVRSNGADAVTAQGRGGSLGELAPPWVALSRDHRGQDARVPRGRAKATRHFRCNAQSSDHQPSEQPGNRTSDQGFGDCRNAKEALKIAVKAVFFVDDTKNTALS